jgi:hypothetical protein
MIFRAAVERAISHLKNWKILRTGYHRVMTDFHDVLRTVTALEIFRTPSPGIERPSRPANEPNPTETSPRCPQSIRMRLRTIRDTILERVVVVTQTQPRLLDSAIGGD